MQRQLGIQERMDAFGRKVIRDYLPEQHRAFYPQLPFVVLGALDAAKDVWATLITGHPGFAHSPDPRTLRVESGLDASDPALGSLEPGAAIGLLGIELHTRRRNRLNGIILESGSVGFEMQVEHAFGNCPQYIQLRDFNFARDPNEPTLLVTEEDTTLTAHAREMIEAADTFFVASYMTSADGVHHVDVSHRGGKAGFVRVADDGTLTIPDFAGNLHFNTLGNFLLNPRAGLVFPDFASGDLLQLTGDVRVVLDSPEIAAFQGAERLWHFRPRRVLRRLGALPLRWVFRPDGWSPNSLMTGDWAQAQRRQRADQWRDQWRKFRITQTTDESALIRSFVLEPVDGAGLITHQAGQHLAIRVTPAGAAQPLIRTYTLSSAPSDDRYRISVKREGLVSTHLHQLQVGDLIEARAPAGSFTIGALERRPAVLLAAGIGITPMLAMARHIVYEGLRTRRVRPTWLFYAARNLTERVFDAELAQLVARAGGALHIIRVLGSPEGAKPAENFDAIGRIDVELLKSRLAFDDYDFYLCGPPAFMQALYDALRDLQIADRRIHAEAFGPASLKRRVDESNPTPLSALPPPSTTSVPVIFSASGKEARWEPESGTLLELAESRGLTPTYGCRTGNCGSCRTRLIEGRVTYPVRPSLEVAKDEALICCAVPAASESAGQRLVLHL